jgi:hypothetical protein
MGTDVTVELPASIFRTVLGLAENSSETLVHIMYTKLHDVISRTLDSSETLLFPPVFSVTVYSHRFAFPK